MYPNVGLKLKNDEYATEQKGNNCAEVLMHLAWDVKELSDLVECGRKIIVECGSLDDNLSIFPKRSPHCVSQCAHLLSKSRSTSVLLLLTFWW